MKLCKACKKFNTSNTEHCNDCTYSNCDNCTKSYNVYSISKYRNMMYYFIKRRCKKNYNNLCNDCITKNYLYMKDNNINIYRKLDYLLQ